MVPTFKEVWYAAVQVVLVPPLRPGGSNAHGLPAAPRRRWAAVDVEAGRLLHDTWPAPPWGDGARWPLIGLEELGSCPARCPPGGLPGRSSPAWRGQVLFFL